MPQYSLWAVSLSLLMVLQIVDAAPQTGVRTGVNTGVNPFNTLGTSLVDFKGCKTVNKVNQKQFIRDAYKEAHEIVNVDGVKANIRWDSEAAADFFGPPQFNKNEQEQIQAVFANVETVQPGYWFNPFGHSLQVRCDDPNEKCRYGVTAYSVNPKETEKPFVNFCPAFFRQYSLEYAVDNYKDNDNLDVKWSVDSYLNRGLILLHELFHLDMAADSEKGTPNPKIFDISIRWNDTKGVIHGPERAYTALLAKLLARFLPNDKKEDARSTGYWVQRNVDNFSRYAMAKYLEDKIGGYPFMPIIVDQLRHPLEPKERQGVKSMIGFEDVEGSMVTLGLDVSDMEEQLAHDDADSTRDSDEVFEVGQSIGLDEFPESYKKAYAKWLDMLKGKNGDGTCKAKVVEIRTCEDEASKLYARVEIKDASGETIYTTPESSRTPGKPIGKDDPLEFLEDGMDSTFTVERGDSYDYLQFSYGSTSWKSSDTSGDGSCKLDGDDWDKDGPECNEGAFTRTFNCQYPCSE